MLVSIMPTVQTWNNIEWNFPSAFNMVGSVMLKLKLFHADPLF